MNKPITDIWSVADTILHGHAMQQLERLPNKSVHLVVTSPPFYGKQYYETEPQIWGGDPDCEHHWEVYRKFISHGKSKSSTIRHAGKDKHIEKIKEVEHATCVKCSAWKGELGQEPTYLMFIDHLYEIFMEVKRVLRDDGQLWIEIGDSYSGSGGWGTKKLVGGWPEHNKETGKASKTPRFPSVLAKQDYPKKSLMFVPTRLAEKLIDDGGWICRNAGIWVSPNRMSTSAQDRLKNMYSFFFTFTKKGKYYSDLESIKIPSVTYQTDPRSQKGERIEYDGKSKETSTYIPSGVYVNPGDVYNHPCASLSEGHFATFPPSLIVDPIKFGSPKYVCKQCGEPKRKIFESQTLERHELPKDNPAYRPKRYEKKHSQGERYRLREFVGYTDCGCGAGYRAGIILDPFCGAGTVPIVAKKLGRHYIGIELNPEYIEIAKRRFKDPKHVQSMHGKNIRKLFRKKKIQKPKIIKKTTIELNATPKSPKETKPLHIWCDGKGHHAMVVVGDHYEPAGSEKCDCKDKNPKYCCDSCGASFNKPRVIIREVDGKEYDVNVCPNCEDLRYAKCD